VEEGKGYDDYVEFQCNTGSFYVPVKAIKPYADLRVRAFASSNQRPRTRGGTRRLFAPSMSVSALLGLMCTHQEWGLSREGSATTAE